LKGDNYHIGLTNQSPWQGKPETLGFHASRDETGYCYPVGDHMSESPTSLKVSHQVRTEIHVQTRQWEYERIIPQCGRKPTRWIVGKAADLNALRVSIQVTTGVLGQGIGSKGWLGNLGEPTRFTARKYMRTLDNQDQKSRGLFASLMVKLLIVWV
jgi:hypothetical protein